MTTSSIILIIIAIVVIYLFIKFIVSPLVKIIFGIVIILAIIYILQNFLNIDLSQFLGPLSPYLDLNKLNSSINGIINLITPFINFFVNQSKSIIPK